MDTSNFDVDHIASLARLKLNGSEKESLACDMEDILAFADRLSTVSCDGIASPSDSAGTSVCRADVLSESFSREELLSSSPSARDGYVLVSRTVGGDE